VGNEPEKREKTSLALGWIGSDREVGRGGWECGEGRKGLGRAGGRRVRGVRGMGGE